MIIGSVRTFPMVTPQHVLPPPLVQLLAIETNEGHVVSMEETDSPVFHVTPTAEDANEVMDLVESSVRRLMANLAARMAEVGPTTKDLSLKVTGGALPEPAHAPGKSAGLHERFGGKCATGFRRGGAKLSSSLRSKAPQPSWLTS